MPLSTDAPSEPAKETSPEEIERIKQLAIQRMAVLQMHK